MMDLSELPGVTLSLDTTPLLKALERAAELVEVDAKWGLRLQELVESEEDGTLSQVRMTSEIFEGVAMAEVVPSDAFAALLEEMDGPRGWPTEKPLTKD